MRKAFVWGVAAGVLATIVAIVGMMAVFGDTPGAGVDLSQEATIESMTGAPAESDAAVMSSCRQSSAERLVVSQVASLSPLGDAQLASASWQEAGPCSWLVSGVGSWQDPLSGETLTRSFSAAVSGDNGTYRLDMFTITE